MSVRSIKLAVVIIFAACATTALAHSGGPSPGYTGAPGEFTCRECHNSFPLNDGVGSVAIEGVPATYDPGETYTITVRVARADRARWGFQMTALTGALDAAGTFQLVDTAKTQLRTEDGRTYVEHKTAGTYAGTTGGASWTVKWTAPAPGTGVVDFYAAGNASNNSGTDKGDNIYTTFAETAETVVSQPFSNVTSAAGLAGAPGGTGIAWTDYDLDGDLDFVVSGASGLLLYRNAGNASFTETSASAGLVAPGARAAAWGDANGDGRPDLLVATATGVRLFTNSASGFVDATAALGASAAGAASSVSWVDVDGDGRLDALLGLDAGAVLLHNEGGTFADTTEAEGLGGVAGVRAAAWADADGDGRADLFVATASGGRLFRQQADSTFDDVTTASGLGSISGATDATWADANGDGRLDLVLATSGGARLFTGDGLVFHDATSSSGLASVAAATVAADDSDGDGRLDLLFSSTSGVRLMRGLAGGFADKTGDAGVAGVPGGVASWADADGDGHVDLLGVATSSVALYRNPAVAQTLTTRATFVGGADALGSTLSFDGAGTQVRVVSGGGSAAQPPARAVFASPSPATGVVRATFPGGVGRERMATTGVGTKLSLERPATAATVTAVAAVTKNGVDKLNVDGAKLRTDVTVVEVDGTRMDATKYPKKKRNSDGTSSRISGTDASFDRLVPRGRRVLVTVFDPDTGIRSAPLPFTR